MAAEIRTLFPVVKECIARPKRGWTPKQKQSTLAPGFSRSPLFSRYDS